MAIVDESASVGGHWLEQYSFVRLHAPKQTYGIHPWKWSGDLQHDLATKDEILAHYAEIMPGLLQDRSVLHLPSHRAVKLMSKMHGPVVLCQPLCANAQATLLVCDGIIDATVNAIPWNSPNSIARDSAISTLVISPAELPSLSDLPHRTFVVIGGGKTACDTVWRGWGPSPPLFTPPRPLFTEI